MSYEQKDNSGALFINERKDKESHPDYSGTIRVNGVDYWISAWTKSGRSGDFFSLSVKEKDGTRTSSAPASPRPMSRPAPQTDTRPTNQRISDDIPF